MAVLVKVFFFVGRESAAFGATQSKASSANHDVDRQSKPKSVGWNLSGLRIW
jgi:hypothetical protein